MPNKMQKHIIKKALANQARTAIVSAVMLADTVGADRQIGLQAGKFYGVLNLAFELEIELEKADYLPGPLTKHPFKKFCENGTREELVEANQLIDDYLG